MLSGATLSASEMTGTAVFRIVVSSDSIKNATATSQGNSRLLESGGKEDGEGEALAGFICFCAMARVLPPDGRTLFRRRPLSHTHQIVGTHPHLKRSLDLVGLERDITARGEDRLIERQIQFAPMDEAERDIVDAGFVQRNATQQQRPDAQP